MRACEDAGQSSGPKMGAAVPFYVQEGWVPIQHNVARAEAYLRTKCYPDPSSHLAITDMG